MNGRFFFAPAPIRAKRAAERLKFVRLSSCRSIPVSASPDQIVPLSSSRSQGLKGRVRVPGDKSISHRSMIFGLLSVGAAGWPTGRRRDR